MLRSICAVFALLALSAGLVAPAAIAQEMDGHLMVMPDDVEWQEPPSMAPGARLAVLEGDPSQEGPFTMRLALPANYDIALHTHPATERVTVIGGTFYLGIGETFDRDAAMALPLGGLAVMEPGVPMYAFTGDEPAMLQLNGNGPWGIEYLNPEDDPRLQGD